MKTAYVWLRPTKASPACRYSYDPEKGRLTVGRKMLSDCAVWMTFYCKEVVVDLGRFGPDGRRTTDVCPFCSIGHSVAPLKELPASKPRPKPPLIHLYHDA